MTNEELAVAIQFGEKNLLPVLWEQTKFLAYKKVNSFYRLYYKRCKKLGIDIDDLTQEAYIGIHRAAERFDITRGTKFTTCAGFHLRYALQRTININRVNCVDVELSLDEYILGDKHCESGRTLLDTLDDKYAEEEITGIIDRCYIEELRTALLRAMDRLDNRRRDAIEAYFFNNIRTCAYAKQIGVSRQTVHTLKKQALQILSTNEELFTFTIAYTLEMEKLLTR